MTTIAIPNAQQPEADVLTGGQPGRAELEQAREAGYRTVVNLRPSGEFHDFDEREVVRDLGMEYVNIPVGSAEGLTPDKVQSLQRVLADSTARPVLVHCASGNRVGALFALWAAQIQGADTEAAIAFGRKAGLTGLEADVRKQLENAS